MTERPEKEYRTFPKNWGAEFIREGEARFRLWAPAMEEVLLRLDAADTPMSRNEDGWFEILATGVGPGIPYAFVLNDGLLVPDPASRAQVGDVNGPSLLIDPTEFRWTETGWRGRPWEEAFIYELHIGTFTPEGTFRSAITRLPHLKDIGITAVEIMPVAQFAGKRGWGYDGVLPYAPHGAYGEPEDMKAFIDAAHSHGLMVLLDVVYNHFGPEGNYLAQYAPDFFHPERHTPWGAAIAFEKEPVRQFFIENALYWLDEYFLDGLRLDAIDAIDDQASETEILVELARRVRAEFPNRHIHLTTEDSRNITHLHERGDDGQVQLYTAEWNDDFHNAAHVIATGETDGYYADFAEETIAKLARSLAEGFAYQGEISRHGGGKPRGKPSAHLPPTAFVDFLQNHDQIGNRAFGDRLTTICEEAAVKALMAILVLSPHIPLLFMGEEWGETRPFRFFTDFHGELAKAVREGRRREFAHFSAFTDEGLELRSIPDPNAAATFEDSKLDWGEMESSAGKERSDFLKKLLELRQHHILPLLRDARGGEGRIIAIEGSFLAVEWAFSASRLCLAANLGDAEISASLPEGQTIFALPEDAKTDAMPPMSVLATLEPAEG
ncbi:MAG TPA: malto-oligosyltrehalose trehalohydrolase [Rhizobiaceae bacterium]|nr:malto-oligosyltrehalose trehalohydrolase [Rhizobiaceae bacterium]